jgi:hypothetical protein
MQKGGRSGRLPRGREGDRAVRQWAEGSQEVGSEQDMARLLGERDVPAVTQAWFQGLNPALAERSPT